MYFCEYFNVLQTSWEALLGLDVARGLLVADRCATPTQMKTLAESHQFKVIWKARGDSWATCLTSKQEMREYILAEWGSSLQSRSRLAESVSVSTEAAVADHGNPEPLGDTLCRALLQRSHVRGSSWHSPSCFGTNPRWNGASSLLQHTLGGSHPRLTFVPTVSDQSDFEMKEGVRGEQSNSPQKAQRTGPASPRWQREAPPVKESNNF